MTRYGRGSSKRSALTWTSSAERASVVRQPTDGLKQPPMHYCTDVPGQFVERAKCGQLVALPHQLLDGDVDQTGRVVHHLRRAMRFLHRDVPTLRSPTAHLEVFAAARRETRALTHKINRVEAAIDRRVAALYGLA